MDTDTRWCVCGVAVPVTGYVGLMGSGKTLRAVRLAIEARREGREVYANFRLGHREWGYLRPHAILTDEGETRTAVFESWATLGDPRRRALFARETGYRVGRGFVSDSGTHLLTSWDDLMELKVARDPFAVAHRDGCTQHDCHGCSKGITVVIDELNLWAPSRLWQELGVGVLNRWAYVRKDGLEIIWTAQHEARIDKVAREVTDFIWNCRKLGGMVRLFGREVPLMVFHRTKYVPALMTDKNRTNAQESASRAGMSFEWSWLDREAAESYDTYEHVADSGHLKDRGSVVPMPVSARRPRSGRSA